MKPSPEEDHPQNEVGGHRVTHHTQDTRAFTGAPQTGAEVASTQNPYVVFPHGLQFGLSGAPKAAGRRAANQNN